MRVTAEALHGKPTLSRQWPALMTLLFELLVLCLNRWARADAAWLRRARAAALYGIGSLAAIWTLERVTGILA